MNTFDEMFPNRTDCYLALFQDAVYEQDSEMNYLFKAGQFKRRDRVSVVKKISAMADLVYKTLWQGMLRLTDAGL